MPIILGKRPFTKDQITKIFSNPVSGIYSELVSSFDLTDENLKHISKIRYSKSMMVKAITFWTDYYYNFAKKLERMDSNPIFRNVISKADEDYLDLLYKYTMVKECPDSFLFSHRYITTVDINTYLKKYNSQNLVYTNSILNKKYEKLRDNISFESQEQTMDPFIKIRTNVGIEFTVFPNEHPYIPRQKISKVGMTEKGNIYVMHKKKKVGA